MTIRKRFLPTVAVVICAAAAYSQRQAPQELGSPLAGLSTEDVALFEAGKADFLEVGGPTAGLGPAFNGRSCGECHSVPAIGGIGNQAVTRAGRMVQGRFVEPDGGSLIHKFS